HTIFTTPSDPIITETIATMDKDGEACCWLISALACAMAADMPNYDLLMALHYEVKARNRTIAMWGNCRSLVALMTCIIVQRHQHRLPLIKTLNIWTLGDNSKVLAILIKDSMVPNDVVTVVGDTINRMAPKT